MQVVESLGKTVCPIKCNIPYNVGANYVSEIESPEDKDFECSLSLSLNVKSKLLQNKAIRH